MKIDIIPLGKENKKTKQQLMYVSKIKDDIQFKKELAELRKTTIIIGDISGYYIPNTKEELQEFIKKHHKQNYEMIKMIDLAYKMLEKMEE